MIGAKKRLSQFEREQIFDGNIVSLALKFDNKNTVRDIVEKLKAEVIGLHLRVEGEYLSQRPKNEIKVRELPSSSTFKSIRDMTAWAAEKFLPNHNVELGTLASNDDTVIITLNHAICDGKFIAGIAHHVGDSQKNLDSYLPITFDEEFSNELKYRSQFPPKFYQNDSNNVLFSKFGKQKCNNELLHECIYDTSSFSIYDKKKKVCKNLTSAIVAGFTLSVASLNQEEAVFHVGGSMACNMRGILNDKKTHRVPNIINPSSDETYKEYPNGSQEPITLRHTNIFTVLPLTAPVTPYTKIDECYKRLATSLKKRFSTEKIDLFNFRNGLDNLGSLSVGDGIMTCFSHMGPIKVSKPATDLYLYNKIFDRAFTFAIPLLTYAIVDEKTDRNEFHTQLRYDGNGLTARQAELLNESLRHFLQNCATNCTIGEAFKEIKEFQKSYGK